MLQARRNAILQVLHAADPSLQWSHLPARLSRRSAVQSKQPVKRFPSICLNYADFMLKFFDEIKRSVFVGRGFS